jgi:glycerol-3-phosphate dehydrogenase (NAD(P)+)
MSYITVVGAGSWGTALACLLAEKGYDVSLWAFEKEIVERIRIRMNSVYLPDVQLLAI